MVPETMSEIFFSSDLHLGHANILRFNWATRGISPQEREHMNQLVALGQTSGSWKELKNWLNQRLPQMEDQLIDQWNQQVGDRDTVYLLGDIFFCGHERAREVLRQLKGNIHLVYGNHDQVIRKNLDIQKRFASVSELSEIKIQGHHVVMCHYPMVSWNRSHYGSFMLYGHVHGSMDNVVTNRSMDVGIDSRPAGRAPQAGMFGLWSWEEIVDILESRELTPHHG